ncbi:hypothetical protein F4810DRAFT_433800 [Camillea tinctor]|nr:hypothetical protein F4810DRAFT_433800 [Camillea tinctor]
MSFYDFMTACVVCAPRKRKPDSGPSVHNAARYNAQLRTNLGLAERPLHLPAQVELEQIDPTQRGPFNERGNSDASSYSSSSQQQQRRFPAVTTGNTQQPDWTTSNLTHEGLVELFNTLHQTLEHVPYAICGLGALIDHGFTARKANKISLICPAYSKDNIKAWAAARGYPTYGDSVGVPLLRDGSLRRVRIKYLQEGFDRLQRVRSAIAGATVLGLASQLDNVAAGYVEHNRRHHHRQGDKEKNSRALATIAADVFWCLGKAAKTNTPLDPAFLPTLLGEAFFVPFAERHVEARPEMARAGIDVAAVLARHRDALALREHDAMLRSYGFRGDLGDGVVIEQPGLFEGMAVGGRDRKSVYTLRGSTQEDVALAHRPGSADKKKKKKKKKSSESLKGKVPERDLGRSLTRAGPDPIAKPPPALAISGRAFEEVEM